MSEYQYYEFQAIDRKLTESELTQIRKLSSRVLLNSHQAIFTYSYGNFRGDPIKVLAKYFDAMLYTANWGTKKLCFRLPANLINHKKILPYCHEDIMSLSKQGKYYILKICIHEEDGGGWVDEEEALEGLLALRKDILNGDYRALYFAWLKAIDVGILEDDDLEPPVPLNLDKGSSSLKRFIRFFEINEKLLKAAIGGRKQKDEIATIKPEKWIKKLSENVRNAFLLGILNNEPHLELKLRKKLEKFYPEKIHKISKTKQRTIGELLEASKNLKKAKKLRNLA